MPIIYIRRKVYDEIVKRGLDPKKFINQLLEEWVQSQKELEMEMKAK